MSRIGARPAPAEGPGRYFTWQKLMPLQRPVNALPEHSAVSAAVPGIVHGIVQNMPAVPVPPMLPWVWQWPLMHSPSPPQVAPFAFAPPPVSAASGPASVVPELPLVPEVPLVPEDPLVPEVPLAPELPDVPLVPDDPLVPASGVPEVPLELLDVSLLLHAITSANAETTTEMTTARSIGFIRNPPRRR